jgi:SSS family solute:Na+ symporter
MYGSQKERQTDRSGLRGDRIGSLVLKRLRNRNTTRVTVGIFLLCIGYGEATSADGVASDPSASRAPFRWERLPDLPIEDGIAGAFIGTSGPVLLLAGGYSLDPDDPVNGKRVIHDSIYALIEGPPPGHWKHVGTLPKPLADGAAALIEQGLLCIGGRNADGISNEVTLLGWSKDDEQLYIEKWPDLPQPVFHPSVAANEDTVYIIGGRSRVSAVDDFLSLPIDRGARNATGDSSWQRMETPPGTTHYGAVLAVQKDGEGDSLYLIGGHDGRTALSDSFRYPLRAEDRKVSWSTLAHPPQPIQLTPAAPVGQSHIIVFGSDTQGSINQSSGSMDILAYHTITNTWTKMGESPLRVSQTSAANWKGSLVIVGGVAADGKTTSAVWQAIPQRKDKDRFHAIDYTALFLYLGGLVVMGFYFSKREQSSANFFLGGQRIPFWAAGLSMMATSVSSVGFMSVPAKAYATNLIYFLGVSTWFIVVPLVTWAIIPFYRRLNVTTAFEYLEARFNFAARLIAAFIFCIYQIVGRLSIVLYIPSLALSAVTGMDPVFCILLMGVLATAYTVLGGLEAVIWTDVIQAVILFGGAVVCLVLALIGIDGGIPAYLSNGWMDGKFTIAILEWDSSAPVLWIVLVTNIPSRFIGLTSDQTIVQRYQSTATAAEAKKALWFDVAVSIPWAIIVFGLGTALYVYYKIHPAELDPTVGIDGIVPLFIVQHVPIGLRGVIIAAIFAAAMSSVDSSMHSVATVFVNDFYARFRPGSSDRSRLALARWMTGLLGVFGTGIALWMASLDLPSIWDVAFIVTGLLLGPSGGLFILGIFTERANSAGALVGLCCSAAAVYFAQSHTDLHFFLYGSIGMAVCFSTGYLASLLLPGQPHTTGLTVYDLDSQTSD